ncbi:hypothetical protein NJ76_30790 [Rhodococcus sp. IITR03]|nr:hypothetical protein NJ76_30790 [Rhodococcus sp. IITR03]
MSPAPSEFVRDGTDRAGRVRHEQVPGVDEVPVRARRPCGDQAAGENPVEDGEPLVPRFGRGDPVEQLPAVGADDVLEIDGPRTERGGGRTEQGAGTAGVSASWIPCCRPWWTMGTGCVDNPPASVSKRSGHRPSPRESSTGSEIVRITVTSGEGIPRWVPGGKPSSRYPSYDRT